MAQVIAAAVGDTTAGGAGRFRHGGGCMKKKSIIVKLFGVTAITGLAALLIIGNILI